MKTIFISLLLFCFIVPASADTWCKWDKANSTTTECRSDSKGYIVADGFKTRTPALANARGYFKVVGEAPDVKVTQVAEFTGYTKDGNLITRTYSVRDLTAAEIQAQEAAAMPLGEYYLWKFFRRIVTQELGRKDAQFNTAVQADLPQKLIDAYLARKAIEEAQQ